MISTAQAFAAIEATWPARRRIALDPWLLRDGQGGGSRVSSATAQGPVTAEDIAKMERGMAGLGQPPLVMIRPGEAALDAVLAAAGYVIADPVVIYAAPVAQLAEPPPPISAFAHWPRLAITDTLWDEGGIGAGRRAVMERAPHPKAVILARTEDQPAGAAFVSVFDKIAMIHAISVTPRFRRKGSARNMLRAAACWSQDVGATDFALVVTERNAAARALYASLGMLVVGKYHYRSKDLARGPAVEETRSADGA